MRRLVDTHATVTMEMTEPYGRAEQAVKKEL